MIRGSQVIDHEIERFIAVCLLLFPSTDLAAVFVPAGAVFGGQLFVVILAQVLREMHGACAIAALPAAGQTIFIVSVPINQSWAPRRSVLSLKVMSTMAGLTQSIGRSGRDALLMAKMLRCFLL